MAELITPDKPTLSGLNLFKAACVRFIRKGEAGEDALTISVSPESLVFTSRGQQINVKVSLFDGSKAVRYGDGAGQFLCSTLGPGSKICDDNVIWNFTSEDSYTFVYRLRCASEFNVSNYNVPFTITYNGKAINRNLSLSFAKGAQGEVGRVVYPYGTWSETIQYNVTDTTTPMVEYMGQFYYATASSKNVNPATDVAGSGGCWGLFDNFSAVFTEILMANFAKLASAVFYGDHMISQYGDDDHGNKNVSNYQDFAKGSFAPYIDINFKTGSAALNNATIRGHIEAQSGSFNGFLRTSLIDIEAEGAAAMISANPYTYKLTKNFNLSFGSNRVHQLKLPNDANYIGARLVLVSPNMYPYTAKTADSGVGIYCESGKIYGYTVTATNATDAVSQNAPDVYFIGGVCELICIPPVSPSYQCNWAIASNNCVMLIKTTLVQKP